jgi:hypothetical protein
MKFYREKYPQPEIKNVAPEEQTNYPHEAYPAYQKMVPDYVAKAYAGTPFWQRFVYPPLHDREHPGETQLLRIGLQNAVGSKYKLKATGRKVPITALIVNPFDRVQEKGERGFTTVQPAVNFGDGQATVSIPASIRRDRERF